MKSKKRADKVVDWWARGIALLSVAVSLAAFVVPYWESKAEKEERLTFWSLLPDPEQPCKIVSTKEEPNLIQMPWTICLSNASIRKTSISRCILQAHYFKKGQLVPDYLHAKDADMVLYDTSGNKLDLPITLDSGESKTFTIYVKVPIPHKIYDIIAPLLSSKPILTEEIDRLLAELNTDLLGAEIVHDWSRIQRGTVYLGVKDGKPISREVQPPTLCLKLITGRGNTFYVFRTPYMTIDSVTILQK